MRLKPSLKMARKPEERISAACLESSKIDEIMQAVQAVTAAG
jgi:hypothetical protein